MSESTQLSELVVQLRCVPALCQVGRGYCAELGPHLQLSLIHI